MCDKDCFNCPYPDCIDDDISEEEIKDTLERDRKVLAERGTLREHDRKKRYNAEHREERRIKWREYYRTHREEIKKSKHEYYLKHRDELNQKHKKYYAENRNKITDRKHREREAVIEAKKKLRLEKYARRLLRRHERERSA